MWAQERSAAEVHQVLEEILARPDFQPPDPAPLWRALGAAWEWVWLRLGDLLQWLAPGLESAAPAWSVLLRAALVVLAAVGVGVLVHLTRSWIASLSGGRRRGPGAGEPAAAAPRSAGDWEAVARSAADEERWREAVMALYQVVIHRLAQDERLRLDPGKTPGDYRRELRSDPRAAALLDGFVRRWEPVAFGRRAANRRAWHELLERARGVATLG